MFARLGGSNRGLYWVIIAFSALNILSGLFCWIVLDDTRPNQGEERRTGAREIVRCLKMPAVWLIGIVVLAAYAARSGADYLTPFATAVFSRSMMFGGALGVAKLWIAPVAALAAGYLADRVGASMVILWSFVILVAAFGALVLMPGSPHFVWVLVTIAGVVAVAVFALKGVYFALLEENRIPLAITGIATGVVSVVGFTPDIFLPVAGGIMLDRHPGVVGYRVLFVLITVLCLVGLVTTIVLRRGGRHDPAGKCR